MIDIASALADIPRPHGDDDPYVEGVVLAVDPDARRLEVAVDTIDNPVTVPVVGFIDDYSDGDMVMLARRPTGYWAIGIMGGRRPIAPVQPSRGTVVALSGSTVTVSTLAGTIVAGSVQSAVISVGNAVVLMWDQEGAPWVVGREGVIETAPAIPDGLRLDLNGSSVTVTWNSAARAAYYGVRWSLNGGSTWTTVANTTGTVRTLAIAQGQTLTVQVRAGNSGGWSTYSASESVNRPLPPPTYETVTTMVVPSDSGTYEDYFGRWADHSYVYQGEGIPSPSTFHGWVGYGSRVRNLGITDIVSARIRVLRGSEAYSGPNRAALRLRATAAGTRPSGEPVPTGPTISFPAVVRGGQASATLSAATCEDLRTGAIRGFVAVGDDKSRWVHSWFALDITYRRPV